LIIDYYIKIDVYPQQIEYHNLQLQNKESLLYSISKTNQNLIIQCYHQLNYLVKV